MIFSIGTSRASLILINTFRLTGSWFCIFFNAADEITAVKS